MARPHDPGDEARRAGGRSARRRRSSRTARPVAARSAARTRWRTRAPARPTPAGPGCRRRRARRGCLCSIVSVAPMKSKTVARVRRTSSQNPEAENATPMAAVVPEHERRHHGQHGGVDVEERERAVEHVVVAQPEVLDHQLGLAHGVAVRQHATLRRPGRARREQHHRRIGDRVAGERGEFRCAADVERAWSTPRTPRAADPARARRRPRTPAHTGRVLGHRRRWRGTSAASATTTLATGQVERVRERRTAERRVDQRRHRTEPAQGQPGDDELGAVRQEDRHQLAAADRRARPGRGERV